MGFEWDEEKKKTNITKHGIDFRDARRIFEKPVLERIDDRMHYGETRWIGLGKLDELTVVAVYMRRGRNIRFISVRKASRKERKIYEERFK